MQQCSNNTDCAAVQQQHGLHCSAPTARTVLQFNIIQQHGRHCSATTSWTEAAMQQQQQHGLCGAVQQQQQHGMCCNSLVQQQHGLCCSAAALQQHGLHCSAAVARTVLQCNSSMDCTAVQQQASSLDCTATQQEHGLHCRLCSSSLGCTAVQQQQQQQHGLSRGGDRTLRGLIEYVCQCVVTQSMPVNSFFEMKTVCPQQHGLSLVMHAILLGRLREAVAAACRQMHSSVKERDCHIFIFLF